MSSPPDLDDTHSDQVIVISDCDDDEIQQTKAQTKSKSQRKPSKAPLKTAQQQRPAVPVKSANQSSIKNYFKNHQSPRAGKEFLRNTTPKPIAATPSEQRKAPKTGGPPRKRGAPKEVPAYKVVEDTTFGVDAFQFGDIAGVTQYFLTHFHADHYVGLKKSFAFPLHVSPITGNIFHILFYSSIYEVHHFI